MFKLSRNGSLLLILAAFSLLTRFLFFGHPNEVVFDETYFGRYTADYLSGSYYFDVHPPLGKLLISASGYLAQTKAGKNDYKADYSLIGNHYENDVYKWHRLLPALAGAILPLLVFLLSKNIGLSAFGAFAAGVLAIFENSLLVQSRFISLDSLLLCFGFLALWLYSLYRQSTGRKRAVYLLLSALGAAFAFSIKWTGLSFLAVILFWELYDKIDFSKFSKFVKNYIGKIFLLFTIGFIVYFSSFAAHFALLPNSGSGDAFMSPAFQKTLSGSSYANDTSLETPSLWGKFIELNKEMYRAHSTIGGHDYSSEWYTWPLMQRSIFYWQGSEQIEGGEISREYIYFIGNPIVYWLSFAAIVLLLLYMLYRAARAFKEKFAHRRQDFFLTVFITFGFAINFIPFIFISRTMFLYHYAAALVFAIIALVFLMDQARNKKLKRVLFGTVLLASIVTFIFFSPLTYGKPLSDSELMDRMWLSSWR